MIYQFINNIGEFFSTGYFTEDFIKKVQSQSRLSSEEMRQINGRFAGLRERYFSYKGKIIEGKLSTKYRIQDTHNFNTILLKALGYDVGDGYDRWLYLDDHNVIPVRHIFNHGGQREMIIMEMQPMLAIDGNAPDGLFEQHYDSAEGMDSQRYDYRQWSETIKLSIPEDCKISPAVINEAITAIFYLPEKERPRYILMMAGNKVYLLDREKWQNLSYLEFDIEQLFIETQAIKSNRDYFALFYLLCSRVTLANETDIPLMDKLEDESYKNAYSVTRDLRDGVVNAVELLANEALWYKRTNNMPFGKYDEVKQIYDETDDDFESEVRDDCLTIIYRLLFLFYAESRPELKILPINDEVYQRGYSLEMLRDLEQVPLQSQQERDGYFFDDSIKQLFTLLSSGKRANSDMSRSFAVKKIDSPMFNDNKLRQLKDVRFRNIVWQDIICSLSLSKETNGKARGRISYANLGINQLGSVYESLLAYRGFYAEEDYIEVHKKDDVKVTYLVPRSRMDRFEPEEILSDADGVPVILKKGSFVYRLNGRDRQKSASYYTPEALTKSTVKYTLMGFRERLEQGVMKADELLNLKILEPAMGAAAFQNEVINQLAKLYIDAKEKELVKKGGKHISPDRRQDETQKVKAYIATHNVYGVDLNPTAIELGKLSLWLNVIHSDMETPFFSNRLALGNAVIGAWLKCYNKADVIGKPRSQGKGLDATKWWEKSPHKISFYRTKVKRSINDIYHFLLPDPGMLAVTGIKELKLEHPEEVTRMKAVKKDWLKALSLEDFCRLQKLSQKIDILLREYYEFQRSIESLTDNRMNIYGQHGLKIINLDPYEEKQRLDDTRYRHDNAYMKLKTVMDYWCSLWFWEYEDADMLPMRSEYWTDIESILDVDDAKLYTGAKLVSHIDKNGQTNLFGPKEYVIDFGEAPEAFEPKVGEDDEKSELIMKTKEQILADTPSYSVDMFFKGKRVPIIQRLSKRYHFFHPMLEFLEVFWLRDGFDIICGNPPWVKWTFEGKNVIAEYYPEVAIHDDDASDIEDNLQSYLQNENLRRLYNDELIETECIKQFLNSVCLYNWLSGAQSDLFKSILSNSLEMMAPSGYMGLVHPNTLLEEPKAKAMRKVLYHRMKNLFIYSNRLNLFSGVHGERIFDVCIYRGEYGPVNFDAISNVYQPQTIDECYNHDGHGICYGPEYIDREGKKELNLMGHKDRIIHYDEDMLRYCARLFQDTGEWETSKITKIHSIKNVEVLKVLQSCQRLGDKAFITVGYDATNQLKDGTMQKCQRYPDYDAYEMIFNSEQVNLLSPFAKMPRVSGDKLDVVDYQQLGVDDIIRTLYKPKKDILSFKNFIDGTGKWFTHYKLGMKKMMDVTHERTLKGAILPPKASHTHSIISASFDNDGELLTMAGLAASIVLDFFIKALGRRNLIKSVMETFPFNIEDKYKESLHIRVLRLNCVNKWYKLLWENNFNRSFQNEEWSCDDARLSTYKDLSCQYDDHVLFRNDYERRMALIEIDVISAMAFHLTLDDFLYIYLNMFNTTQKYDKDTWFDANGRIVFTNFPDNTLDLDRAEWINMRGQLSDDGMSYSGISGSYDFEIIKNEVFSGKVTFKAPYTRCDRIEDYRRAWAFFEKRFKSDEM